jgi:hypothetical protein
MRSLITALAALLAVACPAADRVGRFGICLGGGYDTLAMGDANSHGGAESLHSGSLLLDEAMAGSTGSIQSGAGLDLGLHYRALANLSLGLEASYLMPQARETSASFPTFIGPTVAGVSPADWDYTVYERYNALETLLRADGVLPLGDFDLRLGGGLGWAWLCGASISSNLPQAVADSTKANLPYGPGGSLVSVTVPKSQDVLLYGSAPSFRLGAGVDWWIDSHFSLGLDAGWRWCKITQVSMAQGGSGILKHRDGGSLELDYSGFTSGLKGTFWF